MKKTNIKKIISSWHKKCEILDIELIIAHVLKKDRTFVISNPDFLLSDNKIKKINLLCNKRANDYPLAYILNSKEFYGQDFYLTQDALIPRPETEILVEKTLKFINKRNISNGVIMDIGTGSGIIPITLAKLLPTKKIKIFATDISEKALDVAQVNCKKLNISTINFFQSDLLSSTQLQKTLASTKFDLLVITANLPYVDTAIKARLLESKNSKGLAYEPSVALWSKDGGLFHYKKLIRQTIDLSNTIQNDVEIVSFYEIDSDQTNELQEFIKDTLPTAQLNTYKDLAGKNRVIMWNKNA